MNDETAVMKMGRHDKIRISLVDYLNAAPLGWLFRQRGPWERFEVLPSTPARCAEQLAAGEVQAGLIPSIEYQRIPGLRIIPGIAIASRSAVRSVLLLQPRSGGAIRSVAVDSSSRTSVALLQLLLKQQMGLNPEMIPQAPDPEAMLSRCDAALVIGDAALKVRREDFMVMDLGEIWRKWQNKPFVFAFWACHETVSHAGAVVRALMEARRYGVARLAEIAAAYATILAMDKKDLLEYLTTNIDYELSTPQIDGLKSFYQLCHQAGITSENRPVRFLETHR